MDTATASPQYGEHAQPSSRPSSGYAFLNHSSMTVPNNLPPNADDQLATRYKRRRTSPEDQTVLEAAYSRNPKPDKAERLELVKLVALGEKEVQIWFQNRRQTSRRKSRPLLPHEIVQYQLSHSGRAYNAGYLEPSSDSDYAESAQLTGQTTHPTHIFGYLSSHSSHPEHAQGTNELPSGLSAASQASRPESEATSSHSTPPLPSITCGSNSTAPRASGELSHFVGYSANRRSAPVQQVEWRSQPSDQTSSKSELGADAQTHAKPCLKKSSSFVRLSLSNEGNAKVVTKNASSPSPPRAPPAQQPQASNGTHQQPPSVPSVYSKNMPLFKPLQRSSSGRSRDSRTWEFWCDKDARSELEDKAEKDSSGSAADAIDLLRSTSGRTILGALPNKRNSLLSRQLSSKRLKLDARPSLLKRSNTSLGRLQHNSSNIVTPASRRPAKLKHSESATSKCIPGNDSDKENWSPATTEHTEQGTPSGDHIEELCSAPRSENDPEVDAEIATFMRGSKSTSVSQEEELDCVQNLLSLSQGNWR